MNPNMGGIWKEYDITTWPTMNCFSNPNRLRFDEEETEYLYLYHTGVKYKYKRESRHNLLFSIKWIIPDCPGQ